MSAWRFAKYRSYSLEEGMSNSSPLDIAAAHKYFAAHCFNSAWDLIEKPERTPEDDRMMVALNQASIYHWRNRPDCEPKRLSVGYWQASRIQALLGNAADARNHAEVCLEYSMAQDPFLLGYAYEAMARAAKVAGHSRGAAEQLVLAKEQAALVSRKEDRELLQNDLAGLE
jgi:hypothetical protein